MDSRDYGFCRSWHFPCKVPFDTTPAQHVHLVKQQAVFFSSIHNDGLVKTLISRYPVIPAKAGMTDQMTFYDTII